MKVLKILAILIFSYNTANCQSDEKLDRIRHNIVDPILHYSLSTYISFTSTMILTSINEEMPLGLKYTLSGSLTLAPILGKELYDEKLKGNGWDWADVGYGVGGIATGIALHYFIFDKKKHRKSTVNFNIGKKNTLISYKINF